MTHVNRPADGFHVRYTPAAAAKKNSLCLNNEFLCRRIEGIVDRIRLTGHLDGEPLNDSEPYLSRIMSDGSAGEVVSVLYDILGDSATIRGLTTWPQET